MSEPPEDVEPPTKPISPEPISPVPNAETWKGSAAVPPPGTGKRRRRLLHEDPAGDGAYPESPLEPEPWPEPPAPPDWNPLRPVTSVLPPDYGTRPGPRPPELRRPIAPPRYVPRPPRRRRRKWPWVMLVLTSLTAACCCGCLAWARPFWDEYPTAVAVPPERAAGLVLRDDAATTATVQELKLKVRTQRWLAEDTFAVVYADANNRRLVTVAGATGFVWDPESDLNGEFVTLGVTEVQQVPPGDLGGHQRCGTLDDDVVCGWADHGSIAVGTFPGRSLTEAAQLLRELRPLLVQRT